MCRAIIPPDQSPAKLAGKHTIISEQKFEKGVELWFTGSIPDYFYRHADDDKKRQKPNQQWKRDVEPFVCLEAKENAEADSGQELHTHSGIFY